ncbi:MAG: MATE family efflux transporter [Oscillospiraceae bacterium]|nr:MATE family efflux transporter [Oscillospiraceae bacterium]
MNFPVKSIKVKIHNFFADSDNKLIFPMFFPILIEQFILVMMGTVHSLMLARIKTDAEYIISAVSLVEQINQLAYALLGSVSLGATVIISQYIGAGKFSSAKNTAEQAVLTGFILALAITFIFIFWGKEIFIIFLGKDKVEENPGIVIIFEYSMKYMRLNVISYPLLNISNIAAGIIRGAGDVKSPMRISIVIGIINVIAAGICIYILNLNIIGAGIASIVSRFFGAIISVILLVKKGFITKFENLIKPKLLYIKKIMIIGIFQSIENLIFQFGRTITYRYFNGNNHIAANSIANNIFSIISAPGNSMSIVSMALIGRLTGAGEKKQSYKILRNIIFISMILLLLTHIILLPFFPFLVSFYTGNFDTENLKAINGLIYKLIFLNFIFMPIFWPASFVLFAGMKGAGDVRFTTVISIISMWFVRVLLAYILGNLLKMGVVGVWFGMFFDWIFRTVFAVVRFKNKKWQEKSAI